MTVATRLADFYDEQGWIDIDYTDDEFDVIIAALRGAPPPDSEAIALLRELNDTLILAGGFQARVDAVLDRAEEKT